MSELVNNRNGNYFLCFTGGFPVKLILYHAICRKLMFAFQNGCLVKYGQEVKIWKNLNK